jgi:isopenicillin-N epimerase
VTSITGLVLPIARLVEEIERKRGIPVLVDGAHSPGMVPLDLRQLGASWYTGNAHKWLCAPRGCALLYAAPGQRASTWPLVLSHGLTDSRPARGERPLLHTRFDWQGTDDVSAWLALPAALDALRDVAAALGLVGSDVTHGDAIEALAARNRALVLAGRDLLLDRWGVAAPCPPSMIGSLAAIALPALQRPPPPSTCGFIDPLGDWLLTEAGVEVPVQPFPRAGCRTLRISAAPYNTMADYERLADAVAPWLPGA